MDDSSTPATSIDSLPQEIILKILTTLPPKSVLSFRCTSKFFLSFIPRPHVAFTILVSHSPTDQYTVGYTTEETHGRLQPSFLDLSTIRQNIFLPQAFFELEPGCGDLWRKMFSHAAFGFDPVSKRYKIFKSVLYINNNTHDYYQRVLKVLTLGVDESWRAVTTENSSLPWKPIASVLIDGILYLINFNMNGMDEQEIVVFDTETENLIRVIPFPYIFQHSDVSPATYHSSWVKLNGRLAYIYVDVKRTRIFVCTLDESMGPGWDKHEVPLSLEEAKLVSQAEFMSFTANSIGEIVFLIRGGSMPPTILIYACGTQLWRKFEIDGFSPFENLRRICVYVIEEKVYFSE